MIGASMQRTEDARLVTGAGCFVDDLSLPGMQFVTFVRSHHAHARVRSIDGARALRLPGVQAVFTLNDLPEVRDAIPPPVMNAMPILPYKQSALADGVVRFVGEPIAAVVADSQYRAADAADEVIVTYDELRPVVDAEQARKSSEPLVHSHWNTNVAGTIRAEVGDVQAALTAADLIISERFEVGRMSGLPLETRGTVASWDQVAGMLTVWSSTQVPYGVREYITAALDMPRTGVRVIAPDVGGGFGPKAPVYAEDIVLAAITHRTGFPVKWIETRREAFMATVHGHDQIHHARLGLTKQGRFLVLDDHFLIDNGAYLPRGARTANNVLAHLMGPYRFDAFRCVGDVVVTNKTPNIPFRGAGRLQATFVTERLVHLAADRLGLDPVELKRRNLIGPAELPLNRGIEYRPGLPVEYDSGDYPALLDAAEQMIGYREFRQSQGCERERGRLVGCAIGLYTEGTGVPPAEGASVSVSDRGEVTVAIGASSQGQGHQTTVAQVCAERLGVPFETIRVVAGDTTRFPASPVSSGTFASRIAVIAGTAVALAADNVKEKICLVASKLLECDPGDLVVENGIVHVKGVAEVGLTLSEVARAAGTTEFLGEFAEPGLSATKYFSPSAVTWAAGAHAAIVEVCRDTGTVRVLRYAVAHDTGREINPVVVEGQIHGGVAQGLSSGLLEEISYDGHGQLLTGTFMDYAVPRASTFPAFPTRSLGCPSTVNPLGIKGAGEGGAIPGQAIIANAVADALGRNGAALNRVPLRPERILSLLDEERR